LDIVLLGANQAGYQASDSEKEFLRKCHAECIAFLCICGGFEPTLSAGLLEGKTATAPSRLIPIMQQVAPGTKWVQKRWVRDEKIWTTGSLLNGFDMLAAFAKDTWGEENVVINDVLMEGAWPSRDVDYADVVPMA
jgi:transcriptional regulator GlxA family with amidase domain